MRAGIGTHMDAPAHCIRNGATIADIPLQRLIHPCVMIDVSAKANEHFLVQRKMSLHMKRIGRIPPMLLVLYWLEFFINRQIP